VRFEWWWLEGGSGSIGRVVVVFAINAGDGVTHVIPVAEGYVIGGCSGAMSGSGCLVVVSLERSGQGGSNGTGWGLVVAVLAELWWLEDGVPKKSFFFQN
jgi:hypothetical protein